MEVLPYIHNRRYLRRRMGNAAVLVFFQALAVLAALKCGDWLLYLCKGVPPAMREGYLLLPACIGAMAFGGLFPGWGLGAVAEIRKTVMALTAVYGLSAAAVILANHAKSGVAFFGSYLFVLILVPTARIFAKYVLIRIKKWGLPVVIYGTRKNAEAVIGLLRAEPGLGYWPIGVFTDDPDSIPVDGVPVLGGAAETTTQAACAVYVYSDEARGNNADVLSWLMDRYRTVLAVPDFYRNVAMWVKPRDLQGTLALEVTHNLLDPLPRFIKRAFELLLTTVTLPFWLPLTLLSALAIWLQDRHSPVFAQHRIGRHGREFVTYKLRTMVPDAEQVLEEALQNDPELKAEWEQKCKLCNDPRITALGRFLRVTSLDELPQLINVLKGDMALIGPRPLPRYHAEQLPKPVQMLRAEIRPGLTGMWQVSGRSESGTAGMAKWDPYYVRNWSIWLDLVILLRTVKAVFRAHGAY